MTNDSQVRRETENEVSRQNLNYKYYELQLFSHDMASVYITNELFRIAFLDLY